MTRPSRRIAGFRLSWKYRSLAAQLTSPSTKKRTAEKTVTMMACWRRSRCQGALRCLRVRRGSGIWRVISGDTKLYGELSADAAIYRERLVCRAVPRERGCARARPNAQARAKRLIVEEATERRRERVLVSGRDEEPGVADDLGHGTPGVPNDGGPGGEGFQRRQAEALHHPRAGQALRPGRESG